MIIPAPYVSLGPSYDISFATTTIGYDTDGTLYGLKNGSFGTAAASGGAVTVDGTDYNFIDFYSNGSFTNGVTLPLGDSDMATAVLSEMQANYSNVKIQSSSWIFVSVSALAVSGSDIVFTFGSVTTVSLASDVGNNVNIEWA
jgi:hypothetical protein